MADQSVHPDANRWGGWHWLEPDCGEHFRRCSHCGSMHPDDLAAEPEWLRVSWADQKYGWPHKFYVDVPNRTPERLYVLSASGSQPSRYPDRYIRGDQLTDEQREVVRRDGFDRGEGLWRFFEFCTHPTHHGKFYSIHMSDSELDSEVKRVIEQRSGRMFEFTEGRIRWGPGAQLAP